MRIKQIYKMKTRKTEHLKTVFPQEFYCELAFLGEAKRQGAWTTGKDGRRIRLMT